MRRALFTCLLILLPSLRAQENAPALAYSSYWGGSSHEVATAITHDRDGNVFITGFTDSLDFPATPQAYKTARSSGLPFTGCFSDFQSFGPCISAIFVSKFTPDGKHLIYSTLLAEGLSLGPEGQGGLRSHGIAVNRAGEAFIVGETKASFFPQTQCPLDVICGFIARLSSDGSRLLSVTILGRTEETVPSNVVLDSQENVIVTGVTRDKTFPTTVGSFQSLPGKNCCTADGLPGRDDAFIVKLDPAGTQILYSTYLGGAGNDSGAALAVDASDDIFVGGQTSSTDFPVTAGSAQTDASRLRNWIGFVVKFNSTLSAVSYSTFLGGSDFTTVLAVNPKHDGTLLLAGMTTSPDFPVTPGAFQPAYKGGFGDAFAARLDSQGRSLIFSTFLGGSSPSGESAVDFAKGIFSAADGSIIVVGSTSSLDFPLKSSLKPAVDGGHCLDSTCIDSFVTNLDLTGSRVLSSAVFGGSGDDGINGASLNGDTLWLAGSALANTGVPITADAIQVDARRNGSVNPVAVATAIYLGEQDFEIGASSRTLNYDGHSSVQTTLLLSPKPFFAQQISLSCQSTEFECTFRPGSTVLGSEARELQLTITPRTTSANTHTTLFLAMLAGLCVSLKRTRPRRLLVMGLPLFLLTVSCGVPQVKDPITNAPKSSLLQVVATSNQTQRSITLTLSTNNQ